MVNALNKLQLNSIKMYVTIGLVNPNAAVILRFIPNIVILDWIWCKAV
jgi:hypothetical protein